METPRLPTTFITNSGVTTPTPPMKCIYFKSLKMYKNAARFNGKPSEICNHHPSQQKAAFNVLPKPTLGSRGHKGKRGAAKGTPGDHSSWVASFHRFNFQARDVT